MFDLLKVDSLEEATLKLYNECVNNNFFIDIWKIII